MNVAKTATKNIFFLSLADILSKIINFFYVALTARYLGAANYGMLMFALAFVEICSIGLDLGLSTVLTREVAKDKSRMNKYVNNILSIKLGLSLITLIIIGLILYLTSYRQELDIVIIVLLSMTVMNSLTSVFNSIFQAHNKMQFVSVGRILISLITFLGALALIGAKASVADFSYLYLVASLVVFVISWFIYKLYFKGKISLSFNIKFWKYILKLALPFAASVIFAAIYYRIDSVMLKIFTDDAEVGYYNAAYGLIFAISFIQAIVISAIFPIMSKLYLESKSLLQTVFVNSFKLLAVLAFPIGVGVTLLADKFILIIYGAGYGNSILVLKILIWSLVFMLLNITFANLLNVINKQKIVAYQIIAASIFNVLANLYAIPKYGLLGASLTTVISEIFVFTLLLVISYRLKFNLKLKTWIMLFKISFCSIMMGGLIFLVREFNIFYIILLAVLSYFILVYITRVVRKSDLKLYYKLILNK